MILNNLLAFPFYESREEQHHRQPYVFGNTHPLLCGQSALLPFQVESTSEDTTFTIDLMSKNDELLHQNFHYLMEDVLEVVEYEDRKVLVYKGGVMSTILPLGTFYLEVKFGGKKYYSELFSTVCSTDGLLKLEWYDDETFVSRTNIIYYDGTFKNYIFIKSDIGKPEYTFEEEGEERDGFFFPAKQIATKTYKFSFFAPEYLCDALRMVRMSDRVYVSDQYGNRYEVDSILVTPEWLDTGDLANVTVEFTSNSVVKKLGIGYIRTKMKDFNNDYSVKDFAVE